MKCLTLLKAERREVGVFNRWVFPFLFIAMGMFILVFFFVHQYYLILFPYQLEYREGAICYVVDLMKHGKNFYDFDLQPHANYVYGIGYPFLVWIFSFISDNILVTARIVSTVCMTLTMFIVFKIIARRKNTLYEAFAALALLAPALIYSANLGFPHALVTLLMLTAMYIPWRLNFSYLSVFASLSISVIAFMSKPYGLIMGGILIGYLFLFESKKKAIAGGIFFLLILGSAVLILNNYFEAYFTDTFFSFACVPHMSVFSHALNQLKDFFIANYYFAVTIFLFLYFTSDRYSFKAFSIKIDMRKLNTPFLISKYKFDYFGIIAVFSFILFVAKLGHHVGTSGGLYLYHIFYPFFLIWMIRADSIVFKPTIKNCIWIIYISISAFTFYNYYISNFFTYKGLAIKYKPMEQKILEYKNILGSQHVTSILVQAKRPIINSGQTEYFADAAGCSEQAEKIQTKFVSKLNAQIAGRSFDLILKTNGDYGYNPISNDTLIKYYDFKELRDFMGRNIEFWEPKHPN